jgi:hypothetical protein
MKLKDLLLATLILFATSVFTSCKKDNTSTTSEEDETTFELSSNDAVTENITEDANDILFTAAVSNNFSGNSPVSTTDILGCGSISVTPLEGFPKTINIDFGDACTIGNITRKGEIIITISDSLRKSGSIAVMTFNKYYVNGFKVEGTLTWTNTSQPGSRSWERKSENGKITSPEGKYWTFSGIKNIVQTEGVGTPHNLLDDVFSITGNHTVTNAAGKTRTSTILEALQKKVICENVDKGKVEIKGANHTATIDFGEGTCDRVATISIDGSAPRTILLR